MICRIVVEYQRPEVINSRILVKHVAKPLYTGNRANLDKFSSQLGGLTAFLFSILRPKGQAPERDSNSVTSVF